MKKFFGFVLGVLVILLFAVLFLGIDPFLSGTDLSGFHLARVKRTVYQNYLGVCTGDAHSPRYRYEASICSMDTEKGSETLSVNATAWAGSSDKFPMFKMGKVGVDVSVYQNSPNIPTEFVQYSFDDMKRFWGEEMSRAGLKFSPPQLRIAQAEEMEKIASEARLDGVDWIVYDRLTKTLVVPDPSLWGRNLKPAGQMDKIDLISKIMRAFARSVQESVGIEDSSSQYTLMNHASYLTGVYLAGRFSGLSKSQLPVLGDPKWIVWGYESGDPGHPGPMQSVYSLGVRE